MMVSLWPASMTSSKGKAHKDQYEPPRVVTHAGRIFDGQDSENVANGLP